MTVNSKGKTLVTFVGISSRIRPLSTHRKNEKVRQFAYGRGGEGACVYPNHMTARKAKSSINHSILSKPPGPSLHNPFHPMCLLNKKKYITTCFYETRCLENKPCPDNICGSNANCTLMSYNSIHCVCNNGGPHPYCKKATLPSCANGFFFHFFNTTIRNLGPWN